MKNCQLPVLKYECIKGIENGVDFLKSYVNNQLISITKEIFHPADEVGISFVSDRLNSYNPDLWLYLKTKKDIPCKINPYMNIPVGSFVKIQLNAETCTEFKRIREDSELTNQFFEEYEFLAENELLIAKQTMFSNVKEINLSYGNAEGYEFFIITNLENYNKVKTMGLYESASRYHATINKFKINGQDVLVDIWHTSNNTERDYIMLASPLSYARRAEDKEIDQVISVITSDPLLNSQSEYCRLSSLI